MVWVLSPSGSDVTDEGMLATINEPLYSRTFTSDNYE